MLKSLLKRIFMSMIATLPLASAEAVSADDQNRQTFLPPSFSDSDRLAKIKALFPEIDQIYREYAEKNHFPGYAYGIMVDGQLVHSGAGGFIDLDKKTPATAQSMFRVASITKSFTAMAILRLRDENKLQLDDPVQAYIPEIKHQQLTADAPVITIRDLLTHSAGFPTDDAWGDRKLADTDEEFSALLTKGVCFSHVPRTSYEYSNLGYAILGSIIKKITGVSCAQYIDEMLGLPGIAWDFTKVPGPQLVHGYQWVDGGWREEELLQDGIFGPMGGIIASVESFSQYAAWHLSAWPPRDDKETGPLRRSSIREMHQPWRFKELVVDKYPDGRERAVTSAYGYGLGWSRDDQGKVMVGHNGGLPGFGSNWYILPEYGIGVILFANVTYAPAYKVDLEVLDKLVVGAQLSPRRLPPSNVLKDRQNALVKLLPDWKEAAASGIFADNFFLDHPLSSLKQKTDALFAKAGQIISVENVIPDSQLRGHFLVRCEKTDLMVSFALTPENPALIQECQIKDIKEVAKL